MEHQKYMRRALELAQLGVGNVSPNPAVGSVIVCNDTIIGQGYHIKYGEAHAEVNAINSVKDKFLLRDSTMYVTLEPCSHWGKTPPCADLIIEHKIKKVVIGVLDPYCEVQGRGFKKLQDAGIEVVVGVLEKECMQINAPFFTFNTKKRPYVVLKWAQSSDGFIDIVRDENIAPTWFTGKDCKTLVHKWRSEFDAIMVGRKTVELDDPELTVRSFFGRNPIRITVDKNLNLKTTYKIFNNQAKTILFTSNENLEIGIEKFLKLKNVTVVGLDYNRNIVEEISNYLYNNKINSLFVEGGAILINSFIESNLWNEARCFTSNKTLAQIHKNDNTVCGILAPKVKGIEKTVEKYQNCRLVTVFVE